MNESRLRSLLEDIREGKLAGEEGLSRLSDLPVRDLGHTQLDTHRELRCGHPEVIFGAGKTPEQLVDIARSLVKQHERLLATRLSDEGAAALRSTPAWQAALDGLVGEDGHDIATALGAIAILIPPAGAREALAEIEARGANAAPLIQALWRLLAELHEVSVDPAPPGR